MSKPSYEIGIDRELCMGSGSCTIMAPATFDVDDDSKVVVVDPGGDDLAAIRNAVAACPTRALTLVEEGGT
jgi:ferredoxin